MGASPKTKNKGSNMDFEDEDDFFGAGAGFGQNKADNKKKSSKVESNDPLAFL